MKTGALIIAAGQEKEQKEFRPMLPVGDSTVIRRIIITMQQAGIEPIVVITGKQGDELERHIARLQVISLRNRDYETTQMFDSICMGLRYIEDLCGRVFILPAKFPMFLPVTIRQMMRADAPVVCPTVEGRRGHPVLVSRKMISRILSYHGDSGLRGALRQPEMEQWVMEIPVEDTGIIQAVERKEDSSRPSVEKNKMQIHPKISLNLELNEAFFGSSMAQFLKLIAHTGSMQTACRQMHMSYTKGWNLLKEAERQFGFPLLVTGSGGAVGGFSQLTPKGEELLKKYGLMEQRLREEAERLFQEYFPEYADGEI